jgi:hypothetical protein
VDPASMEVFVSCKCEGRVTPSAGAGQLLETPPPRLSPGPPLPPTAAGGEERRGGLRPRKFQGGRPRPREISVVAACVLGCEGRGRTSRVLRSGNCGGSGARPRPPERPRPGNRAPYASACVTV